MIILAIETSCDETAVAILKDGKELLANEVFSQIKTHQDFGGVIPEVASRIHVEMISLVIHQALEKAQITLDEVDAFGVTSAPGLIGSLHVGLQAAKTLAWYYNKPLIGVHHIAGHIFANAYVTTLRYPFLALVVSGGHTELVLSDKPNHFKVLAQTADDAIGEAYDKVSRLLGLGYPGGPIIDRLAKQGQACVPLPKITTHLDNEFSFSGLKSAVRQAMDRAKKQGETIKPEDMAASFQERALGQLLDKTQAMVDKIQPKQLLLAGGVAANSRLRQLFVDRFSGQMDVVIPPMWCCTDNAAMIAMAAYMNYCDHKLSDLSLSPKSSLSIEDCL